MKFKFLVILFNVCENVSTTLLYKCQFDNDVKNTTTGRIC